MDSTNLTPTQIRQRKYYEEHREEILARRKRYHETHRVKENRQSKRAYYANREARAHELSTLRITIDRMPKVESLISASIMPSISLK